MPVKAYHLYRVMIEKVLLEREENNVDAVVNYEDKKDCDEEYIFIDWPDFIKLNVFYQLFTKNDYIDINHCFD